MVRVIKNLVAVLMLVMVTLCLSAATYKTESNTRFSHKSHYMNNVTCMRCHADGSIPAREGSSASDVMPGGWQPLRKSNIVTQNHPPVVLPPQEENGTFGRPAEKRCLVCHFKTREKADCALCHLDKPGPTERKRKRLPEFVKFDHGKHKSTECLECHHGINDWENLDGNKTDLTMDSCLKCHNGREVAKNCTMCHNPTPRPADHVRNFEKKHGTAYRTNPARCRTCHEDSSCLSCHARKPDSHTLAWVSRRHGIAARTNPMRCQACHSDRWVCKRCHNN